MKADVEMLEVGLPHGRKRLKLIINSQKKTTHTHNGFGCVGEEGVQREMDNTREGISE